MQSFLTWPSAKSASPISTAISATLAVKDEFDHVLSGLLRLASSYIFWAIRPCWEEQLGEIPSCCELVPTLKLFEVELHYLGNDVRGKVQPDENRDLANVVLLSLRLLQKTESPQGRFF